mmetsp:Transcript_221/g.451  ORF Transcript_221/g.451 Transcript_221/m.451 type:complete len:85 (+) Transcript_221:30-284(+)
MECSAPSHDTLLLMMRTLRTAVLVESREDSMPCISSTVTTTGDYCLRRDDDNSDAQPTTTGHLVTCRDPQALVGCIVRRSILPS